MTARDRADHLVQLLQEAAPDPRNRRPIAERQQAYNDAINTYGALPFADRVRLLHRLTLELAQARDAAHEDQASRRGLVR